MGFRSEGFVIFRSGLTDVALQELHRLSRAHEARAMPSDGRSWGECQLTDLRHPRAAEMIKPALKRVIEGLEFGTPWQVLEGDLAHPQLTYSFQTEALPGLALREHTDGLWPPTADSVARSEFLLGALLEDVHSRECGPYVYWPKSHQGAIDHLERLPESVLADAIRSMTTLNRHAAEAMNAVAAHAATDITGFGLLGHLGNMLRASSAAAGAPIGARLSYAALPVFDRVTGFLKEGLCPGGTKRNLEYAAPNARFAESLSEAQRLLLADAQTSGGLLIAVAADKVDALVADLKHRGTPAAAVIGSIVAADKPGVIDVS